MKLKLAVLVYEDDSVLYLPNEEAQEWMDKVNSAVSLAEAHNVNPFKSAPVKEERINVYRLRYNISKFFQKRKIPFIDPEERRQFLIEHSNLCKSVFPDINMKSVITKTLADKARSRFGYSTRTGSSDILRYMYMVWRTMPEGNQGEGDERSVATGAQSETKS